MTADFLPALERAIAKAMPGVARLEGLSRLSGGASQESWSFFAIVHDEAIPLVLRRSPGGAPRPTTQSANSVPLETEAIVIDAARNAGAPAPRVRCVLAPQDGLGSGYVMDRIEGETVARKILRDEIFAQARPKLATQCGEVLARIHGVDTAALTHVLEVVDGPAQLRRYRDLYDWFEAPHAIFELAFQWLEPRLTQTGRCTLVHGDFRNGNLVVAPQGLVGALDWELTHIGDPLEDIGWLCTRSWRFGIPEKLVGGFGELPDLLAGYAAAGGGTIAPEAVRNWIVFGSLKWGIMCMAMYRGFLADGSIERAAIGRRASETEIDLVNLLLHGKW
ncbi:MAG TPA: phosphotransferase family protein [Rhizomicrobium sp.]